MQTTSARPLGVTIIAVLAIIGGILGILGSLALLGLGGVAAAGGAGGVGALVIVLALVALVQSVASLAFGIGAWTLKPWAWTLGVVIEAVSIALSLIYIITNNGTISSEIISIVIAGVVLYYLYTPGVKAAFGRA